MATDWRSLLREIEPKARMTAPASEAQIAEAERAVGAKFPGDLRGLLLQTNGILDDCFGPVLPLEPTRAAPFADGSGNVPAKANFPEHDYSLVQYTLLQRSLWEDDAGVSHSNFVVVGVDVGGNPFGFFAGPGENVRIQCVAHDDGSIEEGQFTLAEYLRHYFKVCRWFEDELPGR